MKLKNRMTREKRVQFSGAAKKVVTRRKRADGTVAVWGPYVLVCKADTAHAQVLLCIRVPTKNWHQESHADSLPRRIC